MLFNIILSAILFLSIKARFSLADEDDPTIITLPNGKIQGHILKSTNNNNYYAFHEIPYATPPVDELRFKEALPPNNWEGTLDATKNTKVCYQTGMAPSYTDLIESEDCLYLNVYTPLVPNGSSEPLSVLFWIHGGGFVIMDGTFESFGPQFFMDYNIIVVTINYRLGPLGFLSTQDGVIPGNLGLKDQNLALQWVKENIKYFGGDPEKVTIAGESAGAVSVGFLLISKRSQGLFRGAILQSGTGLAPYGYQPSARYIAFELGRALNLNFTSDDSTELLTILKGASAKDINNVIVALPSDMDTGSTMWAPVIEDEELDGAFITGPMHEDIKNGNINRVPILIGYNSEEVLSLVSLQPTSLQAMGELMDSEGALLNRLVFIMTDENRRTAESELRKIYTEVGFKNNPEAVVKYMDASYRTPAIRHAELQSSYTDVYLYQFSYKGALGGFMNVNIEGIDPNGVGHAEDVKYMWADSTNSNINSFPIDDILAHIRILRLWSNFVKYLNPTPTEDNLLGRVTWPKVTPSSLTYLNINSTLEVQNVPDEYQKWKEILDKYVTPPFYGY